MQLERYLALDRILPAFKFRDIQSVVTVYSWVTANGFTMDDVRSYAITYPHMEQLTNIGYFYSGDVEHSKRVKKFEQTLPQEVRKTLRKERLQRTTEVPNKR